MASARRSRSSSPPQSTSPLCAETLQAQSPTLPLPSPSIDHRAFPHIIDAVLANASHDGLLALRAASRAWRERIDAHLYSHVAITPDLIPCSVGSTPGVLPFSGTYTAEVGTLDLVHLGPPRWAPSPELLPQHDSQWRGTSRSGLSSRSPSTSPSCFRSLSLSPTSQHPLSLPSTPTSPVQSRPSPIRTRPPPPLPSRVTTLRIIGDLDWTCIGPILPACTTLVVNAPLPLVQSAIYTPRLSTPRGLSDSHACTAYLSQCPRLVLFLPTSLRGTSVYLLADILLAPASAVREVVIVAEEAAAQTDEWRESMASLCCLLGSVLLNRSGAKGDSSSRPEPRFILVNVLEAGAAWRKSLLAADADSTTAAWGEWGQDEFWREGMGLFRLAGHEYEHDDEAVQARMARSVEFVSLAEYEERAGTGKCDLLSM